jgi:hypothetical protein
LLKMGRLDAKNGGESRRDESRFLGPEKVAVDLRGFGAAERG